MRNEFDWSLLVAMRVAVLLNRSRTDARLPSIHASRRKSSFVIELDQGWLEANPLTATELRSEIKAWTLLGIELSLPQLAELETEMQGAD